MSQALLDFLDPLQPELISGDGSYNSRQIGHSIRMNQGEFPDLENVDLVIVGCNEQRGDGNSQQSTAANQIRTAFYQLYHWHEDIMLADAGNIKAGKTLADTMAALRTVVGELNDLGKTVLILGGSHDLSLAQYQCCAQRKQLIEAAGIDARIDINLDDPAKSANFLMEMLTDEPNYMKHYNHIGFQSYLVHPGMLETMDKLRFDCFRVGVVRSDLEQMEPVLRNSHILSFDIAALAAAYAPANNITPNGFTGEDACTLMQYAGMSAHMKSIGVFGYQPELDHHTLTAKQISQMIWYLMDGISRRKQEADLEDRSQFNEFNTVFAEVSTIFLQSKRTGRWWMQLPDGKFTACAYSDYSQASRDEVPERWLRAQERL